MNVETIIISVPVRITYHTPDGRSRAVEIAERQIELDVTNYGNGETVTVLVLRGARAVNHAEASACAVIQDERKAP